MRDLGTWLASIGLDRHHDALTENGIDIDVVGDLTEADLRELGLSLGDRKRFLKAAAALAQTRSEPTEELMEAAAVPSEAERRQLTVMFCDLVGSTELASRLDPEDLRTIIGAYQGRASELINNHGGFVAKYLGDGLLAYFGYPLAHEDDAERAVRAGLALTAAIESLIPAEQVIRARVGIATGLAVVGETIGSGEAQERSIVGETPNLAARLQEFSPPGGVVISQRTRRLVGNLFELHSLGPVQLKGFKGPVEAWRVVGESGIESRFEALRSGYAPLVGRDEELDLLLRRWQHAKHGEGRVVLVSGEPGIGKSRLVREFEDLLRGERRVLLRFFCSSHHQSTPLYPIVAQLERLANFHREETSDARLNKLEALLARSSATADDISLIANLLSLPVGERYRPLSLTPQRRREGTLAALVRQLESLASQQPVAVLVEDIHWLDPTTREWLDLLIERIQNLPVLMIATYRTEFQPPWIGRANVSVLSLNRLDQRQGAAIVRGVAGRTLPADVLGHILMRTDGIPLFLEELTKTLLESGLLQEEGDELVLRAPLPSMAVPATLHDALMARLDRLAAVKEVAQIGSVLGREFSYEVLRAVATQPDERLRDALNQLVSGELLFQRGTPPEATYSFKHALVQDTTYGSLLRDKRQFMHARIAQALQRQFPETSPETLAHHCTEAGLVRQAVEHWRAAGDAAAKQYANWEAVNHYRMALELLGRAEDPEWQEERELQLSIALGPVLMTVMATGSAEIQRVYARARELARSRNQTRELFMALWNYCLISFVSGQKDLARQLSEELSDLAQDLGDTGYQLQAYHAGFMTALDHEPAKTAELALEALAIYDPRAHRNHALVYGGHDPGVCAHSMRSLGLLLTGFPDQAVRHAEESLTVAGDLGHPPSIAHALRFAADVHFFLGRPGTVLDMADAILGLPSDQLSEVGLSNARMLRGWALIEIGDTAAGNSELQAGLAAWRATGSVSMAATRLGRAASGLAVAGHLETAVELVEEALVQEQQTGDRWMKPELLRLRAELALRRNQVGDEAERWLVEALSVARQHSLRWFELRAARTLAGVWCEAGRLAEAHDLLAPIALWFAEGKDIPDLTAALDLLQKTRSERLP
jgi:class 3 adenylate cyclase/predicted ATPase